MRALQLFKPKLLRALSVCTLTVYVLKTCTILPPYMHVYECALLSCMLTLLECTPSYRACLPCYEHSRYACMGISHSNMYVTSTLEHGCALLSCMLRYFNACPPIVHAYIATTPLIVHARISISLSSIYPPCALLMYMNVHSYHACFRCLDARPPIVHAYIATSPLIVHASLSNKYVTSALYKCTYRGCDVTSMRALPSYMPTLLRALSVYEHIV
jgi:hypothetical protein